MIPNVVKGADMGGLMRYLVGPGRENEHTAPHLVAGDPFLMAWHGSDELNVGAAAEVAAYLDEPRKVFGTEMRAQVKHVDAETGAVTRSWKDQHVWHCSLSLRADEGAVGNEQWERIARDFMDRMGFTEASGKAPARWAAVHHGVSAGGNDHIHIAASMVREDGTRWEGRYLDYKQAQDAAREIERAYGLAAVRGGEFETAERGEKRAERATAAKLGLGTTAPKELALRVRAAAVASTSEAEWVRRVRGDGMVIKPYFASGTSDVVAGYRVALKTGNRRDGLVFYGGGRLGRDLSLPRLREGWLAPSLDAATEATAEWQAAFRGSRTVTPQGREMRAPAATAPDVAARNLVAFNRRLSEASLGDAHAWTDAARDVSGALAAWAKFDDANSAELRRAAAVVARSAQARRPGNGPGRRVAESPMGTAFLLLGARSDDRPKIAGGVLLRQLIASAEALRDYSQARGDLKHAAALQRDAVEQLGRVQLRGYAVSPPEHMSDADRVAWAARQVAVQGQRGPLTASPEQVAGRAAASPLPNRLAPRQDRAAAGGTRPEGDRDATRG